jgi:formiminotetrahydrofolate cyclodeaminase
VLIDLSANALLDELAARGEIPGGGSALALALAAAAAIVEMAARISASSWADGVGVAAQAAQLRARAAGLVDADADAYGEVLAMRDVVGTMPVEDRDREVGRAFTAAAEPPLAVARVAAEVAELADLVAARGDEHVHVDAAVAAAPSPPPPPAAALRLSRPTSPRGPTIPASKRLPGLRSRQSSRLCTRSLDRTPFFGGTLRSWPGSRVRTRCGGRRSNAAESSGAPRVCASRESALVEIARDERVEKHVGAVLTRDTVGAQKALQMKADGLQNSLRRCVVRLDECLDACEAGLGQRLVSR